MSSPLQKNPYAGLIFLLALLLFLLTVQGVSATIFLKNGSEISNENAAESIINDPNITLSDISIQVYYNAQCGACHTTLEYLRNYSTTHPDVSLVYHDLLNSTENRTTFEALKEEYNRPYVSVPVIFLGNAGLEGETAIKDNFEPLVVWYQEHGSLVSPSGLPDQEPGIGYNSAYLSFPLIIFAGLLDSINPCACAGLIGLLICLICIRPRKRALLSGIVFSAGIFFIYFLAGTGLIEQLQSAGVVRSLALLAGFISLILGILMIHDGLRPEKRILSGEETEQKMIEKNAGSFILPVAMILGLIIGILELPCTTGIYVNVLSMISIRTVIGFSSLIFYNLAYIVPLLIITGIVYWWLPEEKDEKRERSERIVAGLLMIAFTILIISTSIRI